MNPVTVSMKRMVSGWASDGNTRCSGRPSTARKQHMEVGKDFKLLFHRSPPEALQTFLAGQADALIISPPKSEVAKQKGYPVIIDYFKEGLKIIGPGDVR